MCLRAEGTLVTENGHWMLNLI